jgi:hypothetical protein
MVIVKLLQSEENQMNKKWISKLAGDVELRHGKEARNRIFGDIDSIETGPKSLSTWFDNFTAGMDELDDKNFLQQMMVNHCPCWGDYEKNGKNIKELYDKSKSLEEFMDLLAEMYQKMWDDGGDTMELRGNVLY